ncbi:MAG: YgiQ family radical SAM protein [Candidatus Aureabacteria bacterium]|nr:YgiQ family radical SAM protein [Candidatus Auribacterota bacterium]
MKLPYILPVTGREALEAGWDEIDVLLISGDAYIDHPSFGIAVIGRVLADSGFRVGIIPQPDWKDKSSVEVFGKPRLFIGISSGSIDSMLNNYSRPGKKRSSDVFSCGGEKGRRPDRACIVYSNLCRHAYKDVPIVLGGVEASLRRFAHYDYWEDNIRKSILVDSKADIIVYGMGESQILEIAQRLDSGKDKASLYDIDGIAYVSKSPPENSIIIPEFSEIVSDKKKFAEAFRIISANSCCGGKTRPIAQKYDARYVVQNNPAEPLTEIEMDYIYSLPYTRDPHPVYKKDIPALEPVKWSVTSHRGCFGECSYCSIPVMQGNVIQNRSEDSIIGEITMLSKRHDFKGTVHVLSGPTSNMYKMGCRVNKGSHCGDRTCLFPEICGNLDFDHMPQIKLINRIKKIPGVKNVFVTSGLRYDLVLRDEKSGYLEFICDGHISGQLRVAPEHISERVLKVMKKPPFKLYLDFAEKFKSVNRRIGRKQFLIPYYISAHPGCAVEDMLELALYFRKTHFIPDSIQEFTPTPGSISTCMYYTGMDPFTGQKLHVPSNNHEKALQRALAHFDRESNKNLVEKALEACKRKDLIGFGGKSLISPQKKR